MERICSQCRAQADESFAGDWCPACGGALIERNSLPEPSSAAKTEVDRRGLVLPRRHAVGGVITPQ